MVSYLQYRRPLVPVAYGMGTLLGMMLLHLLCPLYQLILTPYTYGGLIPLIIGVLMYEWASNALERANTTSQPFEPATQLVMHGWYQVSRNPMYLGILCALSGIAILLGSLSLWLMIGGCGWLLSRQFIVPEETMLSERFGHAYTTYKGSVRRWL